MTDDHTMRRLRALLKRTYHTGIAIQGNEARRNADIVAMAASMQLITTRIGTQEYSRTWRVTTKGLAWLTEDHE